LSFFYFFIHCFIVSRCDVTGFLSSGGASAEFTVAWSLTPITELIHGRVDTASTPGNNGSLPRRRRRRRRRRRLAARWWRRVIYLNNVKKYKLHTMWLCPEGHIFIGTFGTFNYYYYWKLS